MIKKKIIIVDYGVGNLKSMRTYADVRDAVRAYAMLMKISPKFIKGEAFVRILLRNLVRDRISIGVGPEEPFELIARKGGLLSLRDPISDMHVDVTAFGQSNSKVFMQLIKGGDS